MVKREFPITAVIDITSEDLAVAFWEMNADEQAEFFNQIVEKSRSWTQMSLQINYITKSPTLTKEGHHLLTLFGDFAK